MIFRHFIFKIYLMSGRCLLPIWDQHKKLHSTIAFIQIIINVAVSDGAMNFMESGQKIYGKFICDIIYINSHKLK